MTKLTRRLKDWFTCVPVKDLVDYMTPPCAISIKSCGPPFILGIGYEEKLFQATTRRATRAIEEFRKKYKK